MNIEHRAAVLDETVRNLDWLTNSVGRKAWAAEVAIRYARQQRMQPDPKFQPTRRIHIHLKEDWRSRWSPTELGSLLHQSLRLYRSGTNDGTSQLRGRDSYEFDFPERLLDDLMLEAYTAKRDVEAGLIGIVENAMRQLNSEMPDPLRVDRGETRIRSVELRVDGPLYLEFRHRAKARGWNPESLLAYHVFRSRLARPAEPAPAAGTTP